jgi:outer membrane protein OmpA-like peptidoglycan-associated protein/tetratricopeptide (TPR) repeat protein
MASNEMTANSSISKTNFKSNRSYNKILEEADLKYRRMEYIEAAAMYEEALSLSPNNDPEILGKVGDCYYFNSEMKKALKWYGEMYKNHKESMSSEYLFKYMHTLKGNNKYGKSKKIKREYLAKIDEEKTKEVKEEDEKLLDELISTLHPIDIKNLKTNSPKSDFSPMYYGDQIVYASNAKPTTKLYGWDGNPFLDLYAANIEKSTGEFKDAVRFPKKINTKYHEASVTFSKDKNTMYFTRNNHKKKERRGDVGINHLMILKSTRDGDKWSKPKILPFNNDNYSFGHPALSADGKKLYFVSNMPGSLGETDIFVADVEEDGSFSAPRNLGEQINTTGREMFPYVTGDKIYFSSDGHIGLGGLDVFEAKLEENGYSTPKNLGKPINSNKDDFSFITKVNDSTGYFASNRAGGRGNDDIYFFKPGKEQDKEKEEPEEEIVDNGSDNKNNLNNTGVNPNNKNNNSGLPNDPGTERTADGENMKIKINNILFNFDRSNITSAAAKELQKVIAFMNAHENVRIKIESHTDSRGTRAYNKILSQNRADATLQYLIDHGVDADRIESAVGYGESRLVNDCGDGVPCSRSQHHKNRRSEFVILN